jgi:hypothetical protein
MPAQAITPEEAIMAKFEKCLPEEVVLAANELIASRLDSDISARFTLNELIEAIQKKLPDVDRQTMVVGKWLDIEPFYQAAGWKVVYDHAGHNETYASNYTFSRAK